MGFGFLTCKILIGSAKRVSCVVWHFSHWGTHSYCLYLTKGTEEQEGCEYSGIKAPPPPAPNFPIVCVWEREAFETALSLLQWKEKLYDAKLYWWITTKCLNGAPGYWRAKCHSLRYTIIYCRSIKWESLNFLYLLQSNPDYPGDVAISPLKKEQQQARPIVVIAVHLPKYFLRQQPRSQKTASH